jgi:predicted NAD-dependent protein-ADP-ribosyltransferase YbiA (DUF1768 family)
MTIITVQKADSLPDANDQGNQPHVDQEGLMSEVKVEVANDQALELFKTLKSENIEAIRCNEEDYKSLVLPAAVAMIRVLLGHKVGLNLTSPELFNWPGFDEKDAKVAYKVHVDSMAPYAQKTAEIMAAFEKFYGFKPFNVKPGDVNVWQKSLHHLHRAPSSGASIDFYFTVKRALDCLKKHGDLRHLTAGELAQAWATLNLIQTNYGSEQVEVAARTSLVNALSKDSMDSLYERRIEASKKAEKKQLRELKRKAAEAAGETWEESDKGIDKTPDVNPTCLFLNLTNDALSKATDDEAMKLASCVYGVKVKEDGSPAKQVQAAAKAQKYISQYFAPNLLRGKVVEFNKSYKLEGQTFKLNALKDSVLVVKPVNGDSLFEKAKAAMLADEIYDGVVFVSRRLMALVLPQDYLADLKAGKLDGKILIGRAYFTNFMVKGGFHIMSPEFMKATGKDMIAYGSKGEICPTWSDDRATIILNSGVPKARKGVCTDTQSLINGFDLRDPAVIDIFKKIEEDATTRLEEILSNLRVKNEMSELDSEIFTDLMDGDESEPEGVADALLAASRLKEVLGGTAKVIGNGIPLPQLVAPIMNQLTNQAMDPARTRLPLALKMPNANGEMVYTKIAESVYPQVHPGLMFEAVAEVMKLNVKDETKALWSAYKNAVSEEQIKSLVENHLKPLGLTYDYNRVIFCNTADYNRIMGLHGSPLVFYYRNPSTFKSGAWGILVPMDSVPVGCRWVMPTPEAFEIFFKAQDGADLDDRMAEIHGDLAKSCIRFQERKKQAIIAMTPGEEKRKVALDFLNSQVGQFRHMALDTRFDFKGWYSFGFGGDDEALVRDLVGDRAANDFVLKELNNAHLKAEERRNRKQAEGKTNAKLPPSTIPVGLTAFIMNMAKLQFAERYFTEGALDTSGNLRVFSSPLERVDSAIFALENMKGTTGTAANVQMLMGAIMQGLVHFGDKFNLRANVRSVIESDGLDPNGEWKSLTYLDLILLTMSEMLSNVIDADTQGQNVPEAVKVMQMIWSVSMYMGLALFGDPSKKVEKYEGETTVSYSMHMLPASQMKFYFPGWLMKRGIAAFAAPFAGQSQLLQEGDAATGQGIKALHFAFKNVKVERATSWVFDLFEKYKDSVLRIAFEQVEQTLEESPWLQLEAALGTHEAEIAGFADFCSRLNRGRFDKIAQVEALPLDKKSRIRARAAVEQAWLKEWHAWNESGKLRFALWTFLQLVKRANAFKTDQANPERALSCEQFIKSGRRSFGSIQVDKLPIHTLYVGNYLNEDGTPVMSADGLPEGPWVYSLKALNVLGASAPQSTVVLGFSFNDEYKDFGKAYFAFINGKGPDVAELGLDIKTPMVKRKSEFGDAFVLDSEVASQINSEVVGQLLSDVLRGGILKTKGENFLGKLRVERGATTLINTAFRDFFKDTKVVTPELLEEFISHKGLDKYRVISIETDVTGNTKASNPAVQVLHPTFKVTVAFEGEVSPLGKLDLSEFAPSVEQVDYTSGPIGYHTDVDFDNYDFDGLEDVAVEDFTYSEVIEAEVVEAKPEVVESEVVEIKTEVKAEPEVEVPTYRHPFTDPDPNLILASKYYEGDEEEEEDFSTWLASQASMAGVGDYRVFDRSAMLVIESPSSLRQLLKIHIEYCLDVKSLQTREDFIEDLKSDGEFFLYLKKRGYTGLYIEVGYFEEQGDMDEAFMEHFLHHFSEPLLFWFYGDEDGSGCHSYRYQLSLDFCSGSDPEPGPAEVEVEPEVAAEVTVYQGLHGRSDGREFQYWTEDKEEAKTYGSQIDSRKVDLTNFLVRLSKDGRAAYEQLRSEHYRETGKPFDLLNPGDNSNAFFTRVKAAGYSGISFLGNDESRYVVTFDGDGDNRTEDIDGYYRLPEKTVTLGVIGTAGRGENLTKEHFLFMVERTKKAVAAIKAATGAEAIRLVSGGAAWSDHVAISLLMGAEVEALTLHLGAEFENNAFTVKEANDAGDAMNKYHRQFSLAMTDGESQSWSLEDIQAMVNTYWNDPRDERHQVTFQSGEIKGLFDRNTLIAEDSDFLIAFTFGENGPIGGVKDTYDKYLALGKKNARHVSLVGVVNDTPPTPPGLPVVHNKHANTAPETAVYIGRPTKWGNPFSHQAETSAKWKCQTRDEAVEKYADWVVQQPELMKSLHELKGKDLVCWCAPKKCHGDILLKLANKSTEHEPSARKSHYGQLVISETDNFKSKDFEFMSNMYPCSVVADGVVFASSETLYQWIKCNILNQEENTILPTDNGYTAKKKAKDFKPSSPDAMATWEALRLDVMYCILESKFADQADTPEGMYLAFRLYAATSGGKVTPVENNHWGDTFWGKCKGKGENHLGQLLCKVANLPKVKLAAKKYVEKFFKE